MGEKDKKSVKSKSSDKKSSKSKDKDTKKSDKKSKDNKSTKSGKSSKSTTPVKEKKDKGDKDKKSSKSKSKKGESPGAGATSKLDIESEMKSQLDVTPKAHTMANQSLGGGFGAHSLGAATFPAGGFGDGMDNPFNQQMANTHVTMSKSCMLHNKVLRYFCDPCEELLCYDCTVMGPHNTQLHRICNLDGAFKQRFEQINSNIHKSLVPKRAQLINQIVRLDKRLEEIKFVKGVIDRDIRNEYAAIMERLRSAEGVKSAVLQHDIAEVQKDITRIDEILMFMEEISTTKDQAQPAPLSPKPDAQSEKPTTPQAETQTIAPQQQGPDSVGFLHGYRQLNENIEYAVTKQFKVDIDVYPNDLPRELAERQVLLEHYEEQRKLLKFKDDVIWKMSQELKKKYDFYQEEFDKETRHEMNEWARLVDRYAAELKKYELICGFCGQVLSDLNINSECADNCGAPRASASENASQAETANAAYFTEEEPDQDAFGKRRHWFGRPSIRGFRMNNPIRNPEGPGFAMAAQGIGKADEVVLQNPEAAPLLKKIYDGVNLKDLVASFRINDQSNSGTIKKEDFVNSVFESVSMKPAELMKIVNLFASQYDDLVNFENFLGLVERYGQLGGNEFKFQQNASQSRTSLQPDAGQKDLLEKVRQSLTQSSGGIQGVEQAMRRHASKGGEAISQDELLVAFSRVNASLNLEEIKEFFTLVRGSAEHQDGETIRVAEVIQLLSF